jgi:hypothetical protein
MSINGSYPVARIQPSNRRGGSGGIGRFASHGLTVAVTIGSELPFIFSSFMVRVGGDVAILDTGDNSYILPGCLPGIQYWAVGKMILTAGTTATGIFVFGGV